MTFLAWIFLAVAILLAVVVWKQRRIIQLQVEKRRELVVGEHRMFAFIHELGEALQETQTQNELYRFIVDGAGRVVGARAGALYLTEAGGPTLIPQVVDADCPPLVPITDPKNAKPSRILSHIKLKSVPIDEASILGLCMARRSGMHLNNLWSHPTLASEKNAYEPKGPTPAMLAPLYFGETNLGVLVLVSEGRRFTANDHAVFSSLADQCSLALGTAQLNRQASDKRHLDQELATAREIQRILLPSEPPQFDGYILRGINLPARVVSGDYFDFIPVDEDHLGVAVADVSGKGIPASFMMAMGRSVLRANAANHVSPTEALSAVNRVLYPDIRADMFVSMVYFILSRHTSDLIMSRAGHDAPLLYRRKTQTLEKLRPGGLALGVDSGKVFDRVTSDFKVQLEPGDTVLIYTDGLTEAVNASGEEFGLARMREAFTEVADQGAEEILKHLVASSHAFTGGHYQTDDITLVVIEKE